jgi:hypothetical protein
MLRGFQLSSPKEAAESGQAIKKIGYLTIDEEDEVYAVIGNIVGILLKADQANAQVSRVRSLFTGGERHEIAKGTLYLREG